MITVLHGTGERPRAQPVVLVADDDPAQRHEITEFLGRRGIATIEANDGDSAIEKARRNRPAVVLMDAKMPDLDGIEAARVMRGFPWRTRIILMSGFADYIVRANRERVGVFAVIEKPVPLRQLAHFIDEALLQVED